MDFLGQPVEALPIELALVREVEVLDAPLITELSGPQGEKYLEVWVDRDVQRAADQTLIFRVQPVALLRFLSQKVALRDLILNTPDGFVFVRDHGGDATRFAILSVGSIPQDILPLPDARFDPSLDPVGRDPAEQSILIDGQWDMPGLASLQRTYVQIYALLFSTAQTPKSLVGAFEHYDINGGWVQTTIYRRLTKSLGKARPRTLAIQYASPGVIKMKVDPDVAASVRSSLERYDRDHVVVDELYGELHGILTGRDKAKGRKKGAGVKRELSQQEIRTLGTTARKLAAALGDIDWQSLSVFAGGNIKNGAELLAAHYRRLRRLRRLREEEAAEVL